MSEYHFDFDIRVVESNNQITVTEGDYTKFYAQREEMKQMLADMESKLNDNDTVVYGLLLGVVVSFVVYLPLILMGVIK